MSQFSFGYDYGKFKPDASGPSLWIFLIQKRQDNVSGAKIV